jgi:hypothetical protein
MAKKRKEKDGEEGIDFKTPKFDEEKFIKKERRATKTMFFSFLFGVLIALISFGFWTLMKGNFLRWELVLLFGVISAAWLRYLFIRLKIDLTDFGRKGWFSSYAVYFFSWLLVLIVIINPPFYDEESPHIEVVSLPDIQELEGTVDIVAKITDNGGIEKQDIDFALVAPDGTNVSPEFTFEDMIFKYTYENTEDILGEYSYYLTATDKSGLTTGQQGTFSYSNDTLFLALPSSGDTIRAAEDIKFGISGDVSRVYYVVNDVEVNATKENDYYETTAKHIGWPRGKDNVSIKIYAEKIYYFENLNLQFNNTIVDTSMYYFNISDDSEIGTLGSPSISLPVFVPVEVPGFELILFIISLSVVFLIFKYRKKDKRN